MPDSDDTTPQVTNPADPTPTHEVHAGGSSHELDATPVAPTMDADDLAGLPSGEPLDVRPASASIETQEHHDAVQDQLVQDQPVQDQVEATSADGLGQADQVEGDPVAAEEPTWRRFDLRTQRDEALAAAQAAIAAGECIVLPTDTVYGIGANAFSAEAVQRLLDAKHRGRDMPPPVLISDPMMLQALGADVETFAERLAEECWPGALTLIVTMQPSLRVDLGETRGTIGLRVPDHEETRELLRRTGPLAVSSANVSGRPSSTNIDDAIEQLGNSVSVYLDAGPTPGDAPSTIIDFVSASFGRIVRQGALSLEAIREVDPFVEEFVDPNAPEPSDIESSDTESSDIESSAQAPDGEAVVPDAAVGHITSDMTSDTASLTTGDTPATQTGLAGAEGSSSSTDPQHPLADAAAAQVAEHMDGQQAAAERVDGDHDHLEHGAVDHDQVDVGHTDSAHEVGGDAVSELATDAASGVAGDEKPVNGADHPVG